ncbi:MAG: 7-cyano-7-deazaguanine synthase [Desulfovibrio sp.]
MPTVLLSLSGGADSATMLARYLHQGHTAETVFFNYGSKQNPWELRAAQAIAAHYGVRLREYDLRGAFTESSSVMMAADTRAIPQSGYDKTTMSQTVVPGRNAIFATVLAGIAESRGIGLVALGMHGGDHYLYPDCRPAFAASLATTITLSTEGAVNVEAPFIAMSKADIIALGLRLGVPYALTRSCYTAGEIACGVCGTCTERLAAFRANGTEDPAPYT